jgi:hypothetical protein
MPTKNSPDPNLTIETAERVFGWRDVHTHDGKLIGKKQDKLGRWRPEPVPDYANDPIQLLFLEPRIKQLGRWERYLKELRKLTTVGKLPGWTTPEQRCRAALAAIPKRRDS